MESTDSTLIVATASLITVALLFFVRRWWQNRVVRVISEDTRELRSRRLKLIGRPDRLIEIGSGHIIPEEKKNSRHLQKSAIAQLGVYLLLVEEEFGRRPPHGYVILEGDRRHKIRNTRRLRRSVLRLLKTLRAQQLEQPSRVRPSAAQCRACGFRKDCTQRRG